MTAKTKVLITEDENIIAMDIANTLKRLGYEVVDVLNSGEEAIAKTRELKPDLVLMDIMLSGNLNGIETAKIISGSYKTPIIYLTALTDKETLEKAKVTDPLGYVLKPFDEKTLHSSIEMALYKHKINLQLKERNRELEEERNKSNHLLYNIFPKEIVKELKEFGFVRPRQFESVSILFTDFQEFTAISSRMHPQELVNELNEIFKNFDAIIERFGLEKLKTMGDSYIVAGGIPDETCDHAESIVRTALEMQKYLEDRNKLSKYKWRMRVGINTGNVVAGVVGKRKYSYEVWGRAVNIAGIMENMCVPGKVNITNNTYDLIKNKFDCVNNNSVEIPGNGRVDMYLVKGAK